MSHVIKGAETMSHVIKGAETMSHVIKGAETMSHVIRDQAPGPRSHHGGSVQSPKQLKAKPGSELLGLSRCAACYNLNSSSSHWHGGNGDSSSSAEDSGSEGDCESEVESSSSSGGSGQVAAAASEKPETEQFSGECGDAAGPNCGGAEAPQSPDDETRTGGLTQRATLVKSSSLASTQAPHLTPAPLLPRPPTKVSTLLLQVLPEQHEDDAFVTVHQHPSARQRENPEHSYGGAERMNGLLPAQAAQWQQMGLPWQPFVLQCQQQLQVPPQHFPPCSARGQTLPPPPPLLQPLTLLQAQQAQPQPQPQPQPLCPQPCIYCYLNTYWSHHNSGEILHW